MSFCNTQTPPADGQSGRHPGGRPRKAGRSVYVAVRLREGEHDEVLARLDLLPAGQRSSYIRRVLAGAPIDLLDTAQAQESERVASLLDTMPDGTEDW